MSRITSVFSQSGHKALMPFITVGYPSIEATLKIVPMLAENGCDIIELGIPYSDPLADGVTIQKASFHALENGVTPQLCLDVARELSRNVNIPLVFMSYYNPVFTYGLNEFCSVSAQSGIDGLIIPDLPPDEGAELEAISKKHNLDLVYLLAPTSNEERIKLVTSRSQGFIYLVSVSGVTGARGSLPHDLQRFVSRVRKATNKPLCIGFGISNAEQARQVAQIADGVIIGSRLIQLMENSDGLTSVCNLIKELRNALDEL